MDSDKLKGGVMKEIFRDAASLEAVLYDDEGTEVDWWDPVFSLEETATHWVIEGCHEYEVPKKHGHRLVVREMEVPS